LSLSLRNHEWSEIKNKRAVGEPLALKMKLWQYPGHELYATAANGGEVSN